MVVVYKAVPSLGQQFLIEPGQLGMCSNGGRFIKQFQV